MMDNLAEAAMLAERATLGSIMIDPPCMDAVSTIVKHSTYFYSMRHQMIFESMIRLRQRGEPIDFVTLQLDLETHQTPGGKTHLEEIGGPAYISDLSTCTPTSIYADHYARGVRREATRRAVIRKNGESVERLYNGDDPLKVTSQLVQELIDMELLESGGFSTVAQEADLLLERVQRAIFEGERTHRYKTGLTDVDKLVGGLFPGTFNVFSGQSSMGKTAFLLYVLYCIARGEKPVREYDFSSGADGLGEFFSSNGGVPVGVITGEMTSARLTERLASLASREFDASTAIPYAAFAEESLDEDDFPAVFQAQQTIKHLPITFYSSPDMELMDMISAIVRMVNSGVKVIGIDYFQLMKFSGWSGGREDQMLMHCVHALAALAIRYNICIIMLSQVPSRDEKPDKRPQGMFDHQLCTQIGQRADMSCTIYRDEYFNPDDTNDPNITELDWCKNRVTGPTGVVKVFTDLKHNTYASLKRIDLNDLSDQPHDWGDHHMHVHEGVAEDYGG